MEYRINKRTGDKISVLGFGTSYIAQADEKDAIATIRQAYEGGVNYFDLATAESRTFPYFGAALGDVRKNVRYQIHFGANYQGGPYGFTLDAEAIKKSIHWQLEKLGTDYIDYGFIHCLDEVADWRKYQKNGALAFLMELKEQGVVRHLGLSSHTPATIQQVMDDVPLDMLMFSVNAPTITTRAPMARAAPMNAPPSTAGAKRRAWALR